MSSTDGEREILSRLDSLERRVQGSRSTYIGNNRILTRADFLDLIYILEADDLLFGPRLAMYGSIEADVSSSFLSNIKPESRCVDVGANFGYYTCMMGKLAFKGSTLGVEADPKIFSLLQDNVAINWLAPQTVARNVAAADQSGTLTLYRRPNRSGTPV